MGKTLSVDLSHIPIAATDTDQDLLSKAQQALPGVLRSFGKQTAEYAWSELERSFRSGPIKLDRSDKSKFLRESEADFVKSCTAKDRADHTENIVEQLKKRRDELAAGKE